MKRFVLNLFLCMCTFAGPLEDSSHATQPDDPQFGYEVGECLPLHVVDFVGGVRDTGGGCPSVMINNRRTKGIEIWTRGTNDKTVALINSIEEEVASTPSLLAFVVSHDQDDRESLGELATRHNWAATHVAVIRSKRRSFEAADEPETTQWIVFFMDGKSIKEKRAYSSDQIDSDSIAKLIRDCRSFVTQPE